MAQTGSIQFWHHIAKGWRPPPPFGWEVTTADRERLQPVFSGVELGHSLTQSYRFTVSTVERTILFVDTNFGHKPGQVSILSGPGLKAEPQTKSDLSHAERISVVVTRKGK